MRHLAIIPVKAEEEGRSLQYFLGKTVIEYCIENITQLGIFDEIMVYTKNPKIRLIAQKNNLNTFLPKTPDSLNDQQVISDILLEIIDLYKSRGVSFRYACSVLPTAETIKAEQIDQAYWKLRNNNLDSVAMLTPFNNELMDVFKMKGKKLEMLDTKRHKYDVDKTETCYYDTKQFYWFDTEKLRQNRKLLGKNSGGVVVDDVGV